STSTLGWEAFGLTASIFGLITQFRRTRSLKFKEICLPCLLVLRFALEFWIIWRALSLMHGQYHYWEALLPTSALSHTPGNLMSAGNPTPYQSTLDRNSG